MKKNPLAKFINQQISKVQKKDEELKRGLEESKEEEIKAVLEFQETAKKLKPKDFSNLFSLDYKRDLYAFYNNTTNKLKAFIVTFDHHPKIKHLVFAENRDKAEAEAQRYIRNYYYPMHKINDCPISLKEARAKRGYEFDEFAKDGQVPIPKLLKGGFTFPCFCCGKKRDTGFTYENYEDRSCYVVEGEGDCVPFARGFLICRDCYKKYYS